MGGCAIATCKNNTTRTKGTNISYFTFPKDSELCQKWVLACRRHDKFNLASARICSEHFSADCYFKSLQHQLLNYYPQRCRRLKSDAVPNKNLPNENKIYQDGAQRQRSQRHLVEKLFEYSSQNTRALPEKAMEPVTVIDLRSDTVTKPTPTMRKAMAEAEVGDDVYREDPTVLKLEQKTAELLGKEAALYFPSGTMANLAAIMAHCWQRGSEILVGDMSHIYLFEQGGAAQLASVHTRALTTKPDGTFCLDEIISKIRSPNVHHPNTALICLENTHNRCGGAVLTKEYIEKVSSLAKQHGFPVHMDGARIMNAAVKLGVSPASLVASCDSVSTCLSKGLGAPVGSLVAGRLDFVQRLLRCRKVLGGGMRQAGVLAAAGLVAVTLMVDRLKEDHDHAQRIAKAVYDMKSNAVKVDLNSVQTNIILIDIDQQYSTAEEFQSLLLQPSNDMPISLKAGVISPTKLRCVLHADISSSDVDLAIKKLQKAVAQVSK